MRRMRRLRRPVIATKDGIIGPRPEGFFLERYRRSYAKEIASFIHSIETDATVVSSIFDGLMNAKIALAAQKSRWKRNRCIKLTEIVE